MRSRVLEAEQGICQHCGLRAHELFLKVRDAPPSKRKEMLENTWLAQLPLKQVRTSKLLPKTYICANLLLFNWPFFFLTAIWLPTFTFCSIYVVLWHLSQFLWTLFYSYLKYMLKKFHWKELYLHQRNVIHPSSTAYSIRVGVGPVLSPAVYGGKAGYTLDGSPVCLGKKNHAIVILGYILVNVNILTTYN